MNDTGRLLLALAERNPITTHADLINIMTGVHAESSVNVEKARESDRASWTPRQEKQLQNTH